MMKKRSNSILVLACLLVIGCGHKDGIEKVYYKDGKIEKEIPYVNGLKNGLAITYYEDGKIEYKESYVNDTLNGPEIINYMGGNLWQELNYKNGKLNGIVKMYYGKNDNSGLAWEVNYTDGKENGVQKDYYPNGKLKCETVYTNGEKGAVKNYDENGNEIKQ